MSAKQIPAGEFKQGCLAILDEVAKTHREVVITKRGKPVARLVPVISDRQREEELLAALRGRARMLVPEDEFLKPLTDDRRRTLTQVARHVLCQPRDAYLRHAVSRRLDQSGSQASWADHPPSTGMIAPLT